MKRISSLIALVVGLIATPLANAGEPTIAPFDSATYDAIYTEAMQAVHKHPASGEIPKELWGEAITKLKPLRVQVYYGHVLIALKEDKSSEEGLYASNIFSNNNPIIGPSDFSVLETLFKPDNKPTGYKPVDVGFLSHYKILKANLDGPANGKHPFQVETNSSSSASGQLP